MSFSKNLVALALVAGVALFGAPAAQAEGESTTSTKSTSDSKTTNTETKPADVYVTIAEGDTLTSIADAHKTTYVRIFNANEALTSPDLINAGDKVRIPREDEELADRYAEYAASVVAAPAVAATQQPVVAETTTTYTTRNYSSAPVNSSSYYVGNGMWCTDYVHSKRPDVAIYGNAGYNWITSAQAAGKSTGTTPQAGSVAVTNGHVAYVESVNPDGTYVVSEMGWNYQAGNYNQRTVTPGTFGQFIY